MSWYGGSPCGHVIRWSNAPPSNTCWTSLVGPAMSGGRRVQIAFARTAFCGALGMSVSSKRAETGWRLSVVTGIGCDNEALEQELWVDVYRLSINAHWRLRLKCRHLVTAFERVLRHRNARHRVHNLLSDFFRVAHIDVTSRIDSRHDVIQRCALGKRISFRHCKKQGVSVFHVAYVAEIYLSPCFVHWYSTWLHSILALLYLPQRIPA